MILLNRGWGKNGPAHSFPPLLFSNLSIYLSVLRFNILFTVSEHSWLSCPKEKLKLRKHLANCNWGGERLGRPILSPPPLGSNLSIYLSVHGLNYSYTESEHSWLTYLKRKFKLQAFSQMILLNRGVGKDWAGPFFPLYYFLTFLFISQSLGLTYSCTVSEHSWLSCPKGKLKLRKHLANCMFLLNSGMGKDWASPFFPPSIGF